MSTTLDTPASEPDDIEVLAMARALDRAMNAAPHGDLDPEEKKAILMTGISDAVGRGVRDEDGLTDAALAALALYDQSDMDHVIRTAPL